MKAELRGGEKIIKEGPANLQRNIETVGGRLFSTNQRVLFVAHKFNFQSAPDEIEISNIQSLQPAWTRFLGLIPVFPNSLSVFTKQGIESRFVLFGRDAWAAAIAATMNGANG
ncbi:hypothetical protein ABE458_03760 [Pseudomonas protegens]|uniref:hypothetical protein n=1 Tax=Pseudomonas protegens TaxID=380021 RepID=UPI00320A8956